MVWLLLTFPSGRLHGRLERWLLAVGVVAGVGLQLLAMVYGNKAGLHCPGCSRNLLQVVDNNQPARNWLALQRLIVTPSSSTAALAAYYQRVWVDSPDGVYGLAFDRFVPARAVLVKQLRGERQCERASEVAALRKPSVAAWAVNQIVRAQPKASRVAPRSRAGRPCVDEGEMMRQIGIS